MSELLKPILALSDGQTALSELPHEPYLEQLLTVGTELYVTNCFRLTGLSTTATGRELSRHLDKLKLQEKYGHTTPAISTPLPISPPPGLDTIQSAIQTLSKDPALRILHEVFWFWPAPSEKEPQSDPALQCLTQGGDGVGKAAEHWEQVRMNPNESLANRSIAIHNLAILFHAAALDLELASLKRVLSPDERKVRASFWRRALEMWESACNDENVWIWAGRRISTSGITPQYAQHLRTYVPIILRSINGTLAARAAERDDSADAERHVRLLIDQTPSSATVNSAVTHLVGIYREKIARICRQAEESCKSDALTGLLVARTLLEESTPLLRAIDVLTYSESSMRKTAHDNVALCAYECILTYENKTQDYSKTVPMFEQALACALSEEAQATIAREIELSKKQIEDGDFWCGAGYFQLPPATLAILERARMLEKAGQYDEAIRALSHLLCGDTGSSLSAERIGLVRRPLALCLNRSANTRINEAVAQKNREILLAALRKSILEIQLANLLDGTNNLVRNNLAEFKKAATTHNLPWPEGQSLMEALRQLDPLLAKSLTKGQSRQTFFKVAATIATLVLTPLGLIFGAFYLSSQGEPRTSVILHKLTLLDERVAFARIAQGAKSPDPTVRLQAVEAWGQLANPRALTVPALILAQLDDYEPITVAAATALSRIAMASQGKTDMPPDETRTAIPNLLQAAQSANQRVQVKALLLLGQVTFDGTQPIVTTLISGLRNKDEKVREAAAETLRVLGPRAKEAAPALLEALRLPNFDLQTTAVRALVAMGEESRVPIQTLKSLLLRLPEESALSAVLSRRLASIKSSRSASMVASNPEAAKQQQPQGRPTSEYGELASKTSAGKGRPEDDSGAISVPDSTSVTDASTKQDMQRNQPHTLTTEANLEWSQFRTSIRLSNSALQNIEKANPYSDEVQQYITRMWKWKEPEGSPGTKAVVRFKLGQAGDVSDITIDQSSGNEAFDRKAAEAIRMARPLPSFPPYIDEPFLEGKITFEATELPQSDATKLGGVNKAPGKGHLEEDDRDSSAPPFQSKSDVLSKQEKEIRQAQTPTPEVKRTVLLKDPSLRLTNSQLLNPRDHNTYFSLVRQRIAVNWDWKEGEGTPGMKTIVSFKLDRSGNVSDVTLQETSGNEAFDREAVKAVRWAYPLPTIPSAMNVPFLNGAMTFETRE